MGKVSLLLKNSLEKYLENNQMSQADLASEMRTSKSFVNTLFTTSRDHRISILDKLSEATGKEPYELLLPENMRPPEILDLWNQLDETAQEFMLRQIRALVGEELKSKKSKLS